MNDHHEVLSAIEEFVAARGIPANDVDLHVATELRVPVDHYVAHRLVSAAIEAYRLAHPERCGGLHLVDVDPHRGAMAPTLRRLFEHAGAIHQSTLRASDDSPHELRGLARDLIGELVGLADLVLAPPGRDPAAASTSGGRS